MSYDLLVMQTPNDSGQGQVTLNLFDRPAQTRGIQTLSQRFLTLLLRETDERFGLGTNLVKSLMGARIVTDPYLRSQVALAVLQVQGQMPTESDDPSELLQSVRVVAARREGDGAFIQLELTSQSGESVTFQLPRIL